MESRVHDRSSGNNPRDATELQKICHELSVINERLEKRSDYHKSRTQNLTISYLLFQVVIFLSLVSENNNNIISSIRCQQWWIPFSMSLFLSIVFFIAFADAVISYYRTQYELDLNRIEFQMLRSDLHDAKTGNTNGCVIRQVLKPDGFLLFKRLLFIWTTVLALVAFTAVALCSCRFMLCK